MHWMVHIIHLEMWVNQGWTVRKFFQNPREAFTRLDHANALDVDVRDGPSKGREGGVVRLKAQVKDVNMFQSE